MTDENKPTENPIIRVEIFKDRMVTYKLLTEGQDGSAAYTVHEETLPLTRSKSL